MKFNNSLLLIFLSVLICAQVLNIYGSPTATSCFDSNFRQKLSNLGLVDIKSIDPSIMVNLKYSDTANFMGTDVYGDLNSCYLQKNAALKLISASKILKKRHQNLSLLVVDGLRPRRIQQKMWNIVKDSPIKKYVANPRYGSMHNYGCAVDITIIDEHGNRLDMGTAMDHFGILSHPVLNSRFLKEKKLSAQQVRNRELLRQVMVSAGFHPIPIEWWHFEAFNKDSIRKTYPIID